MTTSSRVKPRQRMGNLSIDVNHCNAPVVRIGGVHGEADLRSVLQAIDARLPAAAVDAHFLRVETQTLAVHVEGSRTDAELLDGALAQAGAVVGHRFRGSGRQRP